MVFARFEKQMWRRKEEKRDCSVEQRLWTRGIVWNDRRSFLPNRPIVTRVNETGVRVRKRKRKSDESEEIMYSTDTCGFMSRKRQDSAVGGGGERIKIPLSRRRKIRVRVANLDIVCYSEPVPRLDG